MSNNIKIGLIGCGKQAPKHISGLKKIPGVEIVLSDIDQGLGKKLADQENLCFAGHPDKLLHDTAIHAVDICTPTSSHYDLIKKALENNKDVFCEKPLCETLEKAKTLKKLSEETKRFVQVGYIYRYAPIFEKGFDLSRDCSSVESEEKIMGDLLWAFFRIGGRGSHQAWKHLLASDGGAINEMLVHMMDLANWYFGPLTDLKLLSCERHRPSRIIQGREVQVDAEDFIIVRCKGKGGIDIYCQADMLTPAFTQYTEIQGTNGSYMGSIQPTVPSYLFLKEGRGDFGAGRTEFDSKPANLYDNQMGNFIQIIKNNSKPDRNTLEESITLMNLIQSIKQQKEKI